MNHRVKNQILEQLSNYQLLKMSYLTELICEFFGEVFAVRSLCYSETNPFQWRQKGAIISLCEHRKKY